MAKRPEDRFATAREYAAELRALSDLPDLPVAVALEPGRPAAQSIAAAQPAETMVRADRLAPPPAEACRSHRWRWVAAAAAVLVAAAGASVAVAAGRHQRPHPAVRVAARSTAPRTSATFTPDAVSLKGPDFNGYCASIGQASAQLAGPNAYTWRCTGSSPTSSLDLDAACRFTNHSTRARASVADFYRAVIDCWSVVSDLGTADFDGYCHYLGYSGSRLYGGDFAYGWGCENDPNPIRVDDTCKWQFGSPRLTAIVADFYNPNSWHCWG